MKIFFLKKQIIFKNRMWDQLIFWLSGTLSNVYSETIQSSGHHGGKLYLRRENELTKELNDLNKQTDTVVDPPIEMLLLIKSWQHDVYMLLFSSHMYVRIYWLSDGPPPGGEGRKQHLHFADPQHWGSTRVRAQSPPVLPVHPWLRSHARLQLNHQVCRRHYSCRLTLTLNVNKTKEMIVDFRKQQREQPPIHIDRTVLEKVESFKLLGVHNTD